MVITFVGQALFLVCLAIVGLTINRLAKLDITLACLLCGFLAGLGLEYVDFDTGLRAHNLQDLVFFVILPVLIFEAAWHIKPALLKRWLAPILLLATAGVLISCFITAGLVYAGIGHPAGLPWMAALLAGAILAATDPIAVIAQLKAQNAPEDLATLFEGESLFNDASAVVVFSLVLGMATQAGDVAAQNVFAIFAITFFGGLTVGAVTGFIGAQLATLLSNPAATALVVLLIAFGSFYIAEHMLHVSGILAVMSAALVARHLLPDTKKGLTQDIDIAWNWLGLFFNSVLFVIMGLVITVDMFREQWLAMLIAIGAALVGRAAAVALCGLLTQPLKHSISLGWQVLLFWGGLRGAVAVALVLSLPTELDYWYTVQSMIFGVVLFSLLIQGPSNAALIAKFGARDTS